MLRFRRMTTLQKFASIHANVSNGTVRANVPFGNVEAGRAGLSR